MDSIHGVEKYKQFEYEFNWTTILAIIPLCYILPTICVMFIVCYRHFTDRAVSSVNSHVTLQMTLFFIMNILFFFADYMRLYLPLTGLFTSWCASVEPNHYLKLIFMLSFYFQYCVGFLLLLICITRLIILTAHPSKQVKICSKLMYFSIPFIFTVPFLMTFWMIPAMGYCRSMGGYPLHPGAISIYYYSTWFNARNTPFHLIFCAIMCTSCMTIGALIFRRLRRTSKLVISQKTRKLAQRAENALSLSMVLSFLPFLSGSLQTLITYNNQQNIVYMMILRPLGSDCETVIIPWVMYLTHPLFKKPRMIFCAKPSLLPSTSHLTNLTKIS